MLDEKALRKSDWRPGVAVKLGDGQVWEMRKPRIRLVPVRVDEKGVPDATGVPKMRPRDVAELGPESDELLGVLFGELEDGKYDFITARLELAMRLLSANYTLTDADFAELLWYWRDDEENTEMWKAITEVVAGRSPKPTPAT